MLKFWQQAVGVGRPDSSVPSNPFECTFEKAQDWCNFVVMRPGWFPAGCRLSKLTVRAETPEHSSSLRMLLEGQERSLRVKQFYLDWWIPTSSDTNLTGPGQPFVAAGIVGYLGRDYKGMEAACIHRFGSLLELSVPEGNFRPEEIQAFWSAWNHRSSKLCHSWRRSPSPELVIPPEKGPARSLGTTIYGVAAAGVRTGRCCKKSGILPGFIIPARYRLTLNLTRSALATSLPVILGSTIYLKCLRPCLLSHT